MTKKANVTALNPRRVTAKRRVTDRGFFISPLQMFSTVAQTQTTQLWMWKMEYLHHEQRPLYFGEWF